MKKQKTVAAYVGDTCIDPDVVLTALDKNLMLREMKETLKINCPSVTFRVVERGD